MASKLGQIAIWHEVKALHLSLDNPDEAMTALNCALQYQVCACRIFIGLNASDDRPRKQGKIEFNEGSICLARLISLGHFRDAESLGGGMIAGLDNYLFYGIASTSVAPFILDLYKEWKGLSFSLDNSNVKRASEYTALMTVWKTHDLNLLVSRLKTACDYHMERSRDTTDVENFEFDRRIHRIHPAEILALLRLRRSLGLVVPEIEHPVMVIPIAIANRDRAFREDQLLVKIRAKLSLG